MGIWVSIKPGEVDLWLMRVIVHAIGGLVMTYKAKAKAISVFIRV